MSDGVKWKVEFTKRFDSRKDELKQLYMQLYPGKEQDFEQMVQMMYRDYETLFPVLEELNIGFVAFSPLANGFLTGKYDQNTQFEKTGDYRKVMPQFSEEGIRENEKLTEDEIKEIDEMLDNIPMSQVFGGSKVEK